MKAYHLSLVSLLATWQEVCEKVIIQCTQLFQAITSCSEVLVGTGGCLRRQGLFYA